MEKDDSHLANDAPVITDQVMESVFIQIAMQDPSWAQMSNNLLAHEPESDIVVGKQPSLVHGIFVQTLTNPMESTSQMLISTLNIYCKFHWTWMIGGVP